MAPSLCYFMAKKSEMMDRLSYERNKLLLRQLDPNVYEAKRVAVHAIICTSCNGEYKITLNVVDVLFFLNFKYFLNLSWNFVNLIPIVNLRVQTYLNLNYHVWVKYLCRWIWEILDQFWRCSTTMVRFDEWQSFSIQCHFWRDGKYTASGRW